MSLRIPRPGRDLVVETAHFALSPQTFVMMAILPIVPIIRRGYDWGLANDPLLAVFVSASLLSMPVVFAATRVVLGVWRPRGTGIVMLALTAWIAVPVLRLWTESIVGGALGSQTPIPQFPALASSLVANLAWTCLISAVQATSALRRRSGDALDRAVEDLRARGLARWRMLDDERTQLARSIRRSIAPTIEELSVLIETRGDRWQDPRFADLVPRVAERSRELVREASHEMQILARRSDQLGAPMIGPRADREAPIRGRFAGLPPWDAPEIRIHPVLAPALLLAILGSVVVGRATASLLLNLTIAAAMLAVLLLLVSPIVRGFQRRHPTVRPLGPVVISYAACVPLAFGVTAAFAHRVDAAGNTTSVSMWNVATGVQLVIVALFVVVCCLTSLWLADRRILRTQSDDLLRTRDALDALETDMALQYARMCAQTGGMLHGPVQGRLATIAMTLRLKGESISDADLDACRELLLMCLRDLDRMAEEPLHRPQGITQVLQALRMQWAGMLEVTWSIHPEAEERADTETHLLLQVEALLSDLASNAVRHGAARRLQIEIGTGAGGGLVISARDDGLGPQEPISAGGGLGFLGIRGEQWDISRDLDGWCRVSTVLPLPSLSLAPGLQRQ